MKTLALRIYLAVVAVLLIFALVSGWLAQRNLEHQRQQLQTRAFHSERAAAWAELIENSLPPATAPAKRRRCGSTRRSRTSSAATPTRSTARG